MMSWLKEQDKELARLRTKLCLPIWRFGLRSLICLGAFAELILYALTNEELIQSIKDADFGIIGWHLEHSRRREWKARGKARAQELLEEEYGLDSWAEELIEKRLRLEL